MDVALEAVRGGQLVEEAAELFADLPVVLLEGNRD